MKKTYLLYARVSPKGSTWAAQETSIPMQLQECRQHVLRKDPDAEFIEVFDEQKSGKSLKRPGIQQIIKDIDGKWDCLVVWHLDRLSRSISDSIPLFKLLRDHNKGIMSVKQEQFDMSSAGGRLMMHILISTAEYEREMTSERVSMKMRRIAELGKMPWGRPTFGYKRSETEKNKIIPSEDAPTVVKMFKDYLAGRLTLAEIKRASGGKIIYHQQIARMLRNKMYIGLIEYAGKVYQGEHKAIIDEKIFREVQEKLEHNSVGPKRIREGRQKHAYILAGYVHCHCGACMSPHASYSKGKKYYYYRCTDPACHEAVAASALEDATIEQIRRLLVDGEALDTLAENTEKIRAQEAAQAQPEYERAKKELGEAKARIDRATEAFEQGLVSKENAPYWNRRLMEAREEWEQAKERVERLTKALDTGGKEDIRKSIREQLEAFKEAYNAYENAEETKRAMVAGYLSGVFCQAKNQFQVELVVPKMMKWRT